MRLIRSDEYWQRVGNIVQLPDQTGLSKSHKSITNQSNMKMSTVYKMNHDLSYVHREGEISANDIVRMLVLMEAHEPKESVFTAFLDEFMNAYKNHPLLTTMKC